MRTRTILACVIQSAPAALNPDPTFGVVLITAFVPVPVMAPVLVVTMKPDPAILPYPMALHPEKIRTGRRGNLFAIGLRRPVLIDPHLGWRRRGIMIIAITMIVAISVTVAVIAINPVAIDPNPAVLAAIPVAWHPDGLGSRRTIPMASNPFPMVSVPCPVAFHPKKVRAGLWASVFIPRRRWRFAYDDDSGQANGNTNLGLRGECCAGNGA
jgi:hypothetical protein